MLKPKVAMVVAALAIAAYAQEPQKEEPANYYRLDFTVKEVEGAKVINARQYSTMASTRPNTGCRIRTSTRVPYTISVSPQPQFAESGVNLDCNAVREVGDKLSLRVSADISSPADTSTATPPTFRRTVWEAPVIIPLKKPSVIFSSDDPGSKRTMQLEITATPIT